MKVREIMSREVRTVTPQTTLGGPARGTTRRAAAEGRP
ncbi:hypothetical protein ACLBWA_20125, partial [Pseudomonas aeruginosa]